MIENLLELLSLKSNYTSKPQYSAENISNVYEILLMNLSIRPQSKNVSSRDTLAKVWGLWLHFYYSSHGLLWKIANVYIAHKFAGYHLIFRRNKQSHASTPHRRHNLGKVLGLVTSSRMYWHGDHTGRGSTRSITRATTLAPEPLAVKTETPQRRHKLANSRHD